MAVLWAKTTLVKSHEFLFASQYFSTFPIEFVNLGMATSRDFEKQAKPGSRAGWLGLQAELVSQLTSQAKYIKYLSIELASKFQYRIDSWVNASFVGMEIWSASFLDKYQSNFWLMAMSKKTTNLRILLDKPRNKLACKLDWVKQAKPSWA